MTKEEVVEMTVDREKAAAAEEEATQSSLSFASDVSHVSNVSVCPTVTMSRQE